jgi:putative Mn2+ efflux pump MntP
MVLDLIVIAVGVSMDATAVATAHAVRGAGRTDLVTMAGVFGVFQFAMALVGALGGSVMSRHFETVDHWIAFALLVSVGARMIWLVATRRHEDGPVIIVGAQLLMLGIATSIDALAVGVTLPALGLGAWGASLIIGVCTFALSLGGAYIGKRIGERFGSAAEVLGGLLLIALGFKTAVEHTLLSGN